MSGHPITKLFIHAPTSVLKALADSLPPLTEEQRALAEHNIKKAREAMTPISEAEENLRRHFRELPNRTDGGR